MPTEHTSQEHQQGHINGPPTQAGPRRDHHTSRAAQRPPCDPRHTDQPNPTINHTRPPNRDHSKLHWLFATTPGFSRDHIPTIHRIYATKPLVRTRVVLQEAGVLPSFCDVVCRLRTKAVEVLVHDRFG